MALYLDTGINPPLVEIQAIFSKSVANSVDKKVLTYKICIRFAGLKGNIAC